MQTLTGRLLYMGWLNLPWKLITNDGEVDLRPLVEAFLISLNSKKASHRHSPNHYTLTENKKSEFKLDYVPGEQILLKGNGWSNVHAHLDDSLIRLSGRLIIVEIEEGKSIIFKADESESVPGLYFTREGNSCGVPSEMEKAVCKAGQKDCCVFLLAGSEGFSCEKFNAPLARMLLDRLAKGTMQANRIGNCTLVGRK